MSELVRYDEMCRAIDVAFELDEVAQIHDQAKALEYYMRQQRNVEAERRVCEIRLRAERKLGTILSRQEKAKGAPGNQHTGPVARDDRSKPQTLSDLGISKTQSSRWQKLAAIPEDEFEATFAQPEKPSTTGIIAAHLAKSASVAAQVLELEPEPEIQAPAAPKPRPVDVRALWLWGRLLDFEREGLLSADPESLFETMLPHMKETTLELAPVVAAWLARISA